MADLRKIDLHMHSKVSDGTDSPEDLVEKVREAGFSTFAVTDHDTLESIPMIRAAIKEGDPRYICGVEFSCKDEQGRYHILGCGFDPDSSAIHDIVSAGHDYRIKKFLARVDILEQKHSITFPSEEIEGLLALGNPGRLHLANLMIDHGYVSSRGEAFDRYLNNLHVEGLYFPPEDAIRHILAAGGVPVMAHPVYGSGGEEVFGHDLERRVIRLKDAGLCGLEAFYSRYTPELRDMVLDLADKYDLFATAGSDYHGAHKKVALGDIGPLPEEEAVLTKWEKSLDAFLEKVL